MTKQKLTFNTIMERVVIWSTVIFVFAMLIKNDLAQYNIRTEGNIKYNQYIYTYIKNNPDMVPVINKYENCYRGNIYAVEGCYSYVYKGLTQQQHDKLYEYTRGLEWIVTQTKGRLKD